MKMNGGLTTQGTAYLATVASRGLPLDIVTFALGSGYPLSSEDYRTFTNLKTQELTIPRHSTQPSRQNTYKVTAQLDLPSITHQFVFHELGILGKATSDSDLVMIAYFYAEEGESINPQDLIERTLAVELAFSTIQNLTVVIDDSVEWVNRDEFEAHINDKSNPHAVTKQQVGLGLVENQAMASLTEALSEVDSNKYMNQKNTKALVADRINKHIQADNPHNITKETVGLGNVDNYATATTSDVQANVLPSNKFMTPQMVDTLNKYKIALGAYLLSQFTDYKQLVKGKQITGTNITAQWDEETQTLKLNYIGATGTTIHWENIVGGLFDKHPDVVETLKHYISNIVCKDGSISILPTGNDSEVELKVTQSVTFNAIGGDPTDNTLLSRILESKIEASDITGEDSILVKNSQGTITISLNEPFVKQLITWANITGNASDNNALTNRIKELALQPSQLSNYITAGDNIRITKSGDSLVITATSTASIDASTLMSSLTAGDNITITQENGKVKISSTGGGGTGTVSFGSISGKPSDNALLMAEFAKYLPLSGDGASAVQLSNFIGAINREIGANNDGTYPELPTTAQTLIGAVAEVFQLASDTKENVCAAIYSASDHKYNPTITTKGVELANMILDIGKGAGGSTFNPLLERVRYFKANNDVNAQFYIDTHPSSDVLYFYYAKIPYIFTDATSLMWKASSDNILQGYGTISFRTAKRYAYFLDTAKVLHIYDVIAKKLSKLDLSSYNPSLANPTTDYNKIVFYCSTGTYYVDLANPTAPVRISSASIYTTYYGAGTVLDTLTHFVRGGSLYKLVDTTNVVQITGSNVTFAHGNKAYCYNSSTKKLMIATIGDTLTMTELCDCTSYVVSFDTLYTLYKTGDSTNGYTNVLSSYDKSTGTLLYSTTVTTTASNGLSTLGFNLVGIKADNGAYIAINKDTLVACYDADSTSNIVNNRFFSTNSKGTCTQWTLNPDTLIPTRSGNSNGKITKQSIPNGSFCYNGSGWLSYADAIRGKTNYVTTNSSMYLDTKDILINNTAVYTLAGNALKTVYCIITEEDTYFVDSAGKLYTFDGTTFTEIDSLTGNNNIEPLVGKYVIGGRFSIYKVENNKLVYLGKNPDSYNIPFVLGDLLITTPSTATTLITDPVNNITKTVRLPTFSANDYLYYTPANVNYVMNTSCRLIRLTNPE